MARGQSIIRAGMYSSVCHEVGKLGSGYLIQSCVVVVTGEEDDAGSSASKYMPAYFSYNYRKLHSSVYLFYVSTSLTTKLKQYGL